MHIDRQKAIDASRAICLERIEPSTCPHIRRELLVALFQVLGNDHNHRVEVPITFPIVIRLNGTSNGANVGIKEPTANHHILGSPVVATFLKWFQQYDRKYRCSVISLVS